MQPSTAAAERVFSLLNSNAFGDLQENSLRDYIEASVMFRFNQRDL